MDQISYLPEDKIQGLTFLGGVIAKKCFKIDETLGYYRNKWEPGKKLRETAWFIDGMNRGGMRYPTDEFFTSLKLMNLLFERYHPNGKLRKGTVHHFIKLIRKKILLLLRCTLGFVDFHIHYLIV